MLLVCYCAGPCAFKTYPLSCRNLPVIRRGPLEGWRSPYGNPYNDRTTTQHVELNGSERGYTMNQVLYTWNIPIHPHIRCICVDASPHAAHYTARGTRTGHGCVPTQTMVLLFLAAPPHCCSAMFRAGAPQCKEYLEIHRNPHHIDSKELLTVGKTRTAPFWGNALP